MQRGAENAGGNGRESKGILFNIGMNRLELGAACSLRILGAAYSPRESLHNPGEFQVKL